MADSLIDAAAAGDLEKVGHLLASGQPIDSRDAEGDTALTTASAKGNFEMVRFLLEKGADIEAKCNAGNSPICAAAGKGHTDILALLLENGADPNACNHRGYSPLLLAAYNGVADCVNILLEHGANPNTADNDGLTPLIAAAYKGSEQIVMVLLSAGAAPNARSKDGKSPLAAAANRGALECVKKLLAAGVTAGESGAPLLAYAMNAPTHSDEIAATIIETLGNPSGLHQGHSPLFMAISNRRDIVVEALLRGGSNPNETFAMRTETGEETLTPLIAAASIGHSTSVKLLLDYGAEVNFRSGKISALAAAKIAGHREVVQLLIRAGATVEGAATLLHDTEADPGFELTSPLAADLSEAWRVSNDHANEGAEVIAKLLSQSPRIQEKMSLLRLTAPPDLFENYPVILLLLLNMALSFINTKSSEVAQIISANHIGLRKRRADDEKARTACIRELATSIARDSEFYEDSDEALAIAEFVLSRFPYRELAKAATSQKDDGLSSTRDGVGYEDRCQIDLEANGYLVRKTPLTGDQGADLLASKGNVTYAIQCKNYAGAVGNGAVQEAISARSYYRTDYAVVVSDGRFTNSARELAAIARVVLCKRQGLPQIDLLCSSLA